MIETKIKKLNGKKYLKLQNLFNSYSYARLAANKIKDERNSLFSIYIDVSSKWNELFSYYSKLVRYDVEKMDWFEREYK